MTLTLSDSLFDFSDYLFTILVDNQPELEIAEVTFGDVTQIIKTPLVCVEPVSKSRELAGAPRAAQTELEAHVLLYHSRVSDSQDTAREVLQWAEGIETKIHQDRKLGGLVTHSMVDNMEAGYVVRGQELYRSYRLKVTGTVKVQLPL